MADDTSESILDSVRDFLDLNADDSSKMFDRHILGHINSSLQELVQVGCGNDIYVKDGSTTWEDFLGASKSRGMAMDYVFSRVTLLFDPPATGASLKAMQDHCSELLWRISVQDNSYFITGNSGGSEENNSGLTKQDVIDAIKENSITVEQLETVFSKYGLTKDQILDAIKGDYVTLKQLQDAILKNTTITDPNLDSYIDKEVNGNGN